jgi:hypothetical protein
MSGLPIEHVLACPFPPRDPPALRAALAPTGFWLSLAVLSVGLAACLDGLSTARAHDDNHPHVHWYRSQTINPAARVRLNVGYTSCCDEADHYETRFRMVEDGSRYGEESYEYLKDDAWKLVPPDIIQRKPTPDGRPVLFINRRDGRELCFIIDREGI